MSLSSRGQSYAKLSQGLPIWKILKDLWDPQTNPSGYVSLGVAENDLMHEDLRSYINSDLQLSPKGLSYGEGSIGSKRLRAAAARQLTRKLRAAVPIQADDVCVTNGVSSSIELISTVVTDPGDAFLIGRPYYRSFIEDIGLRTGAEVVGISFGDVDPFSAEAVSVYEDKILSCHAKGQRVAGVMLCNPHNPLGRCYSREFLIGLMKLCQQHKIHLISDEIYALSIFDPAVPEKGSPESQTVPFTSLCAIPTEGLIDPSLTHILYGLSKDFGASGLRVGFVISQNNPELHHALVPLAKYSYASSLAESTAIRMLEDDSFIDWYVTENSSRLAKNYQIVKAWAESHKVEYARGTNAAFFFWVNLGPFFLRNLEAQGETAPEGFGIDTSLFQRFLDAKVFVAAGGSFGSEKPGWCRLTFSAQPELLKEGLSRIEKALGLSKH